VVPTLRPTRRAATGSERARERVGQLSPPGCTDR
jgi:hypothetical protein